MPSLADLVGKYDQFIDRAVRRVERGGLVFPVGPVNPIDKFSNLLLDDTATSLHVAFAALYQRMQAMEQQHPKKMAAVAGIAYCPALEDAVAFITANRQGHDVGPQEFAMGLSQQYALANDGKVSFMHLFHPLRAAIFLELLLRHPDKLSDVTVNSAYFPQLLLKKGEKMSITDLEQEIAGVIPTLYSEDAIRLVAEANRFFERANSTGIRVERYIITQGFRWREEATADDFSRTFDVPAAKQTVLSTLLSSMMYIKRTTVDTGKRSPKKLHHFYIPDQRYMTLAHVLHGHAKNQIVQQLRQGAEASLDTPFTRYAGLHGRADGGSIIITHHHDGGTERISLDAKQYDTSTHLPTSVAVFADVYNTAMRLSGGAPNR